MGLCPGPETDDFDVKKYRSNLKKLEQVLKGERENIIRDIEKRMTESAKKEDFELAARLRNQLRSLQRVGRIKLKDEEVIGSDQALADFQNLLGLKNPLKHIEGFDISHMSGKDVVASQVVFKNGVSSKTDYRHYKITNQQNNDFESMADVISRRFKDKNVEKWGMPDLLLIDGGKGQLGSAQLAAPEDSSPMFGLAKQFEQVIIKKDDPQFSLDFKFAAKTNRIISDEGEFYVISFSKRDPVRLLLERIRNEAHRFAVRYHTKLKRGHIKTTELTKIPGIGAETARKLLITFGSVAGVKSATHNQLASTVGNLKAKNIERYFSKS